MSNEIGQKKAILTPQGYTMTCETKKHKQEITLRNPEPGMIADPASLSVEPIWAVIFDLAHHLITAAEGGRSDGDPIKFLRSNVDDFCEKLATTSAKLKPA